MKLKKCFKLVNVSDEYLLVPLGTTATEFQGIVAINEATAFLLSKMVNSKTQEELLELLVEEYNVEREIAKKDIACLIAKLASLGILEEE